MLLFFLLSLQASGSVCPSYGCPTTNITFTSATGCTNTTTTSVYLKACPAGQTCNLSTGQCASIPTVSSLNYPGEKCTYASSCISKNCTQNICVGVPLSGNCTDDTVCSPGLRCLNSQCRPQLAIGQSGCYNDYDCVNSAGCNQTTNGSPGTCYAYLSVSTNSIVSDCSGGVSNLCKTSECYKTATFGSYGVCKLATQSLGSLPVNCTSNANCLGTDGRYEYTGTCTCGYNKNGTSYCMPFNGDLPGLAYYQSWQNALNASASVCNTARRFSSECLNVTGYLNKITKMTWGFLMYPLIQNNDACVQEILNYEFYGPFDYALQIVVALGIYFI